MIIKNSEQCVVLKYSLIILCDFAHNYLNVTYVFFCINVIIKISRKTDPKVMSVSGLPLFAI